MVNSIEDLRFDDKNFNKERWKVVPNFEDYEASNMGRIRRRSDKRIRALRKNKLGYVRIDLYKNHKPHWLCVHRIVAQTFLENNKCLPQVNHKNGIKDDNRVENLEWCSRSDNIIHAYKNKLRKPPKETPVRCIETGEEFANLWEFDREPPKMHPTMKPIGLVAYALNKSSKKDDVILDCFGGSGSTLIACEQLDRKCYMMELDPKYCDVIRKRWWKFTQGTEDGWEEGTPAIGGEE